LKRVIEACTIECAVKLTLSGIGTIIGKKTRVAGRDYTQVLLYIPKEVVSDSAFPFALSTPCEIIVDAEKGQMVVRPIGRDEAIKRGWVRRSGRKAAQRKSKRT
jgi:hypothetical protein